jgi:tRNA-Thr(GGU) m(6)t(6)A37 methyltransferase TsaA
VNGEPPEIVLYPIGVVRNQVTAPRPEGWRQVESRLVLTSEATPGLQGIEGFSHVIVVCWLHMVPQERRGAQPEPAGPGLPPVGPFASRRQSRPNPLGVAVVSLVRAEAGAIVVRGLDAIDGTPVLDIKPYLPPYDSVPQARMPRWVWG